MIPKRSDIDTAAASEATFLDQLLQPQTLQRMMAAGGAVLVIGFVGWLWSIGLFENAVAAAVGIGAATAAILGVGIALVRNTRYQLAGQGITVLGALAMPLNLWFYDAQGLVTISEGGHLWIPAAVCCAIYALVARVLRHPLFVYAFVGGVVMTGLLFLADESINRFWELLPPATLLVGVGVAAVFVERSFPDGEGDFSSQTFGAAFFRAGGFAVAVGLALVLVGQINGALQTAGFGLNGISGLVMGPRSHKLWALGLIASAMMTYAFDFWAGKKRKSSGVVSGLLGVWGVLVVMDLLSLRPSLSHIAVAAGLATILVNTFGRWQVPRRSMATLVTTLSTVGLFQFGMQFVFEANSWFYSGTGWLVVTQMGVTGLACVAWHSRQAIDRVEGVLPNKGLLCLGALFAGLAVISAFAVLETATVGPVAVGGFAIAGAFLGIAANLPAGPWREHWQSAASAAVTTILVFVSSASLNSTVEPPSHLTWSWVTAFAAAIYFAAGVRRINSISQRLGFVAASAAVFNVMQAFGLSWDYAISVAPTTAGLCLLAATRVMRFGENGITLERVRNANVLVVTGSALAMLMSLCRVIDQHSVPSLVGLLGAHLVAVAICGIATRDRAWRVTFRTVAICLTLCAAIVIDAALVTHWLHRIEIGGLLVGLVFLTIGHIAWYREGESQDDGATAGLWLGSLLTAVPIGIGLVVYRAFPVASASGWLLFHEIAAMVLGLCLLAAGIACHIRATTFAGGALLATTVVSLVAIIQWPHQLHNASVAMMISGGFLFAAAVALSIYRDRIAALPREIKEGRGVFRVLKWR